jgi:diguanylate cyclase (GGDEF)-like protein/PAS domain S-box-containing protein
MGGVALALFATLAFALGVVVGGFAFARTRTLASRRSDARAKTDAERRLELLSSSAPLGIFELDARGAVRYANRRWVEMSANGASQVGGRDVWAGVHESDKGSIAGRWHKAITDGEPFRARFRLEPPVGEVRWVVGQTTPLRDERGAVSGHVGLVLEVTDLVEARQNLLRFQAIIESTTDLVGLTDGDGQPLYLNRAAREALGIAGDADLSSIDPSTLYTEGSWRVITAKAIPAVLRGEVWRGELSLRSPEGARAIPISNVLLAQRTPSGDIDFVASIARDTSAQKALEARLQHQADHDELTSLPNRTPLITWLDEAIRHVDRFGSSVAVLFSDIDRFKVMNDSLGHHAGDQLLVAMSRRLLGATRPHDRIARFGGDEFVVLCTGVDGPAEAAELADRIRREVGGRFSIGDQEVFVTMSIGVALATGRESAEELLRDADAAMYEAKARGRDRVQVFDARVRAQVVERLDIEQALRHAIEREELVLEFQPVVDLPSGRIRGVEALVRWDHPARGLLLPAQFLGVAEETGLIVDMGRWILTEACRVARETLVDPDTGRPLPLFVNLSPRQLADVGLVPMVQEVIDLTGVDPQVVHLEITEDALMADAATTSTTLDQLHGLGVRLALDDFGTGHSSLAYLKQFPVEILKIDRTFIEGLGQDSGDRAITAAIVNVARMLGLSTVAEGVERPDQAAELAALGCDQAQGFHFARPMYASELAEMLPRRAGAGAGDPRRLTNP